MLRYLRHIKRAGVAGERARAGGADGQKKAPDRPGHADFGVDYF